MKDSPHVCRAGAGSLANQKISMGSFLCCLGGFFSQGQSCFVQHKFQHQWMTPAELLHTRLRLLVLLVPFLNNNIFRPVKVKQIIVDCLLPPNVEWFSASAAGYLHYPVNRFYTCSKNEMSGTRSTTRFIGFYIPVSKNKTTNLLQSVIRQHIPFHVCSCFKFSQIQLYFFTYLFQHTLCEVWNSIASPDVTQKSLKLVQLFIMISLFFTYMIAVLLCAVSPHLCGKTSAVATRPPIRFN